MYAARWKCCYGNHKAVLLRFYWRNLVSCLNVFANVVDVIHYADNSDKFLLTFVFADNNFRLLKMNGNAFYIFISVTFGTMYVLSTSCRSCTFCIIPLASYSVEIFPLQQTMIVFTYVSNKRKARQCLKYSAYNMYVLTGDLFLLSCW